MSTLSTEEYIRLRLALILLSPEARTALNEQVSDRLCTDAYPVVDILIELTAPEK